ncbi:GNAT family N-acetyltransferase [Butyrivibrio sp. FC2001]|uniref:GNAT family N-acetyltransferase n=1 Tax=Butyrivibrio sp. FC2001 TaxID=1280671 RepID=UPI000689128E|nr:GNAT family N-acetyltransferase [Butyrivibrio sp. FC2001]
MRLRRLERKDAPLMLEWMHDDNVTEHMHKDFKSKTINDCISFIECNDSNNIHRAIADDFDQYMGTVSLKKISSNDAEFGIAIRECAMGKGYSQYGMKEMLEIGFKDYSLKSVYWCVDIDNKRALRFYDKQGYKRVNPNVLNIEGYSREEIQNFVWYITYR